MKKETTKAVLAYWSTLALGYLFVFVLCFIDFESRGEPNLSGSMWSAHRFALGAAFTHAIAFTLVYIPWLFLIKRMKVMKEFPLAVGYMMGTAWILVFCFMLFVTDEWSSFAGASIVSITYGFISGIVCWIFLKEGSEPVGAGQPDNPPVKL